MSAIMKAPASHRMLQLLFMFLLAVNMFPLLWILINSLRSDQELNLHPFALPSTPLWSNYAQAWETANLGAYFLNSLFISLLSVLVTLIAGTLASYFLSRFEFKARSFIFMLFVLGMLIPVHATLVPLFIEMKTLNLLNTRLTLLFPYVAFGLPLVIFILVSFMNSFPRELEEAAIMDGSGAMTIFGKIILPMCRPALATAFILTFLNNWNELSFALVLINETKLKTLPLGLALISGQFDNNYTVKMAAFTIVLVPTVLFYVLLQKHVTEGLTAGAVKG
ncbi:carbohydrate ABC transporter permease [Paenibacillus alkalitolerans]|uniref:carbohydrate ABC transporter permease n=1 Tax=Paenibacillus alkalitolerans TaxID=2799335 RepID=UPI0018F4B634|nr:carbohydrate ABC transporter permease [Paenibacillus alkalitolerans]